MRMSLNNRSQFETSVVRISREFRVTRGPDARELGRPGSRASGFSRWAIGGFFCRAKPAVPMHSITHALNIGTLALWMSVAVFGSAGLMLGRTGYLPVITNEAGIELAHGIEIESIGADDGLEEAASELPPIQRIELPSPPEMLAKHESDALPEVPDMSVVESKKVFPNIKSSSTSTDKPSVKDPKSVGLAINSSNGLEGSASGAAMMSNAARLAAGRMPAPRYPSEARSKGQSGTVLVEFTVDASGRVSTASIASPCPWSVLNEEALRAVKNWKFPPGGVMTYKKPIVFKLRNS